MLVGVSSFAFTLTLFLVLSTPFVEMSGVVSSGQSVYRIYAYALAGLLQVALVFLRGSQRSLRLYATALTPFLIWAGLSLLWTQHIDLTGKRLALLVAVYAGIFGGICDLPYQRSLLILRAVLLASLVLNLTAVFIIPDVGMHDIHGGNLWRGFMGHKNIAGMLCAFTVILFAFDGDRVPHVVRFGAIGSSLIFLAFSWSKTALIALPIALSAGGAVALIGRRSTSLIDSTRKYFVWAPRVIFALVVVVLLLLTVQRDIFLSLTDDTTTLTYRGAIWRPMIQSYLDSPFLGSGYGAYWNASDSLIDSRASKELWKNVDQGHNGYLDLLVQVGLPGLALALYAVLAWPLAQIPNLIGRKAERGALILAVLVFSLIENFSESTLLADDALGNGLVLIALAQFHRFALRLRDQEASRAKRTASATRSRKNRQKRHQNIAEN